MSRSEFHLRVFRDARILRAQVHDDAPIQVSIGRFGITLGLILGGATGREERHAREDHDPKKTHESLKNTGFAASVIIARTEKTRSEWTRPAPSPRSRWL